MSQSRPSTRCRVTVSQRLAPSVSVRTRDSRGSRVRILPSALVYFYIIITPSSTLIFFTSTYLYNKYHTVVYLKQTLFSQNNMHTYIFLIPYIMSHRHRSCVLFTLARPASPQALRNRVSNPSPAPPPNRYHHARYKTPRVAFITCVHILSRLTSRTRFPSPLPFFYTQTGPQSFAHAIRHYSYLSLLPARRFHVRYYVKPPCAIRDYCHEHTRASHFPSDLPVERDCARSTNLHEDIYTLRRNLHIFTAAGMARSRTGPRGGSAVSPTPSTSLIHQHTPFYSRYHHRSSSFLLSIPSPNLLSTTSTHHLSSFLPSLPNSPFYLLHQSLTHLYHSCAHYLS